MNETGFEFTDEELSDASKRREAKRVARESQPEPIVEALGPMLDRLRLIGERAEAERRALPCFPAVEVGNVSGGASACRSVGALDACTWRRLGEWCAIEREGETARASGERMTAGGVPGILASRVLACIPGVADRVPLDETEALRVVRAFASAPRSAGVRMDNGETIAFTGSEWVTVLGGPVGTGKSLAAAYFVARVGGLWLSARHLANPKFDLDAFEKCRALVVDDLGTEYNGGAAYGTDRASALLESRHAEQRRTLITTNLASAAILDRYGVRLASRLREGGRFVGCVGADLRAA